MSAAPGRHGNRAVLIVWGRFSPRCEDLALRLGAELRYVYVPALAAARVLLPLRYLLQSAMTLRLLVEKRPAVILVQNPPVFAPVIALLYGRVCRRTKVVVDSHSGAFNSPSWRWSVPLQQWLSRYWVTIVHNEDIMQLIGHWPGKRLVVDDPPVAAQHQGARRARKRYARVQVVCSGAWDEPIDAVLAAAALAPRVQFHITGDRGRVSSGLRASRPPNVTFTGFLPRREYLRQLCSANAVMVLTIRDGTMQQGAWEAMYCGQPLILSDTTTLRRYFESGAVFVSNTVEGILTGVRQALDQETALREEMGSLAAKKRQQWLAQVSELEQLLGLSLMVRAQP